MKTVSALAVALAAAAVSATPSPANVDAVATKVRRGASLPTITTSGNAFWDGDTRFYIKGIDYQPGGSSQLQDPLASTDICGRDIKYFEQLKVNVIRVYTVDNSANHDDCMEMLAQAGIYLALDVNTPYYSIDQDAPEKSYNPYYLQNVFATIDAFAGYTNTLLFTSGNEVINAANNTDCAPYVKATNRDMKQYIRERGYRPIPIGYAAADVEGQQYTLAQYFDCGDEPSRADFYGINNYQWCDDSSLQRSGWNLLSNSYSNFSIPIFLSEYGCLKGSVTRWFQETPVLYTEEMTKSMSGGMVYEYAEQGNGYGIVNIEGSNVVPIAQQFDSLQQQMAKIVVPSGSGGATTQNVQQQCPGQLKGYWDTAPFIGSALPATPSGALQFFKNGAGKGVGFAGKGSQWETGGSSSTASASAGAATTTYGSGSTQAAGGSSGSSSGSSGSSSGASNVHISGLSVVAVALSFVFGLMVLH